MGETAIRGHRRVGVKWGRLGCDQRRKGKRTRTRCTRLVFSCRVWSGYQGETKNLSCVVGGVISQANDRICLRSLLALNDVEFDIIALFEGFITVQLDRRVMDENIWPVFTSDESVALGIVEPLNLTFELSHRLPPSLHRQKYTAAEQGFGYSAAATCV